MKLEKIRVGVAMCGSFCTFEKCFTVIDELISEGAEVTPVMSFNAASTDTRFGKAHEHIKRLETLTGKKVIKTIEQAEPLGPKNMLDVLLVANCTGNTLAKLSASITDTPVTMAVKSHLRAVKPVVLCVATNDALAGTAKNIGQLMNYKNYFFVPLRQDDFISKPSSIVADFSLSVKTLELALDGKQLQPIITR